MNLTAPEYTNIAFFYIFEFKFTPDLITKNILS